MKIGTRGSQLAMWQARFVESELRKNFPDLEIELVKISTKGDRILDSPLSKIGGKGLFTKEIESQILSGEIDLAVHSLKDLPTKIPDGLEIGAITRREDPRDCLVSKFKSLDSIPPKSKIGTSSLRRRAQILNLRPDLIVEDLRGNVQTRLSKLDSLDGIILAVAGLTRLELENRITEIFETDRFLPAVGQGALAIEIRADDSETRKIVETLNHEKTSIETQAERSFLDVIGGSCQIPVGVFAKIDKDQIEIDALISSIDGKNFIREKVSGHKKNSREIGSSLADKLLRAGGSEILREIGF